MAQDFAFIQTAPGRLFVGWGPFQQLPMRRAEQPGFYITDFFLDDPHPWRHPSRWEELTFQEFADAGTRRRGETVEKSFPASPRPRVTPSRVSWRQSTIEDFEPLFTSARDAICRGDFNKIVPVIFESGQFLESGDRWPWLLSRLDSLPNGMWAYGYSYKNHGLIGATPEVLFESEGRGYRTMALAGTRRIERAAELLHDPKELREHRLVVDDIVRRLAPFGNVGVGELGILELPSIAHLTTSIRFEESGVERMTFAEMVRRLHPTAALGCSPRNEAGEAWLREADRIVKRRTFGAPIGIEWPGHASLCLVAIRNLEWHGDQIRIGSGAGLLAESVLEREFEELRQKREQAKELFALEEDHGSRISDHGIKDNCVIRDP